MIKRALLKNSRWFSSRSEVYMARLINPKSIGLTFQDTTPQWKQSQQRTLSIFKELGFGVKNVMEERILREVRAMTEYVQSKRGEPFDPKELSTLMTSNVIINILFGHRHDFEQGLSELIVNIDRIVHLMDMTYDIAPFLKYIPAYRTKLNEIVDCSRKAFQEIEKEITQSLQHPDSDCFVLRYFEKEPDCDKEQLNFILRDLIAGGTDTTATTLRWLLLALANHLEIQKELQEDIDSVIPRDQFPTMQDEIKLPYVQATILELYRWRTLLPMGVPRQASSDSFLDGLFIRSGTTVIANLYCAHNDPSEWGDPEVFRPERFLDKNRNVIHTDLVIPFSLGRRSCLGEMLARAEIFLLMTSVVQRFNVLPPEGQEKVSDKIEMPIKMVISPEPFAVRLIDRC